MDFMWFLFFLILILIVIGMGTIIKRLNEQSIHNEKIIEILEMINKKTK